MMWLVELTLFAFQLLSMLCTSHDFSTSHAWSSKREREIGLLSKRVGFDVDIEGLVYGEERLLTFICE
jgi:hypothetical protein